MFYYGHGHAFSNIFNFYSHTVSGQILSVVNESFCKQKVVPIYALEYLTFTLLSDVFLLNYHKARAIHYLSSEEIQQFYFTSLINIECGLGFVNYIET